MDKYNDELAMYQQQIFRKQRLEEILKQLEKQSSSLKNKADELAKTLAKEQRDVEKIEGVSLSSIFFNIIGKKEERIDKEKREAYAALLKYDNAKRELEEVYREIELRKNELNSLVGCEDKYKAKFKEKVEYIKKNDSQNAREIIDIENKITYFNSQIKEINEAIVAGKRALEYARDARDCLDSADSWSTWDLFSDGMMADIMKHSKLDEAQECVSRMQSTLRRFKTELSDVNINADITVKLSGFTEFADYFFDGLFVDLAVKSHIESLIYEVSNVSRNVSEIVNKLENNSTIIREEIDKLNDQYDNLVRNC